MTRGGTARGLRGVTLSLLELELDPLFALALVQDTVLREGTRLRIP